MPAGSPGTSVVPALGLCFSVSIGGVALGTFTGCEGLQAEYEVFEYQEGGENFYTHRFPSRLKYQNIKLTRPLDKNSGALAAWFSDATSIPRKQATITAHDPAGTPVASWTVREVVPVKYTGPTFATDGNTIAKESLELAHHGFDMVVN